MYSHLSGIAKSITHIFIYELGQDLEIENSESESTRIPDLITDRLTDSDSSKPPHEHDEYKHFAHLR